MIEIGLWNYIFPILSGIVFILLTGFIPETHRQNFHAIVVAVAAGSYLSGALGQVEGLFTTAIATSAFFGLTNWQLIGLAWFLHGIVDLIHHAYNDPLFTWYATSSFECFVVDWFFTIWFLMGAPNLTARLMQQWKSSP